MTTEIKVYEEKDVIIPKNAEELCKKLGIESFNGIQIYGNVDAPLYVARDIETILKKTIRYAGKQSTYIINNHVIKIYIPSNSGTRISLAFTEAGLAKVIAEIRHPKHKCKSESCIILTSLHYKGYCKTCYQLLRLETKTVARAKEKYVVKEIELKIFKLKRLNQIICVLNYRPDIYYDCDEYAVIVEIDENQHIHYTDEDKRIACLRIDAKKPIHVIRFNPDHYKKGTDWFPSCWHAGKVINQTDWDSRLKVLITLLEHALKTPPSKNIEMHYLYYNE